MSSRSGRDGRIEKMKLSRREFLEVAGMAALAPAPSLQAQPQTKAQATRPALNRFPRMVQEYFIAQVKAFRDGTRRSFVAGRGPTINMSNTAKAMRDDEIVAAARYFADLPAKSFVLCD